MISFQNDGEIDPLAITTMGVNAKEGENPIGFFGTGLKYAIAIVLRLGGSITIWRGEEPLRFGVEEAEMRGKSFSIITMNGERLGFTTELGKTWQPWMVYRELYCNAIDEGGEATASRLEPRAGATTIHVSGLEALDEAHAKRSAIMLSSRPVYVADGVEVHRGQSNHLYYRGILVAELEQTAEFTYNVTSPQILTEDRTLKNLSNAIMAIRYAIVRMTDLDLLREWLQAAQGSFENKLDLNWWSDPPSAEWLRVGQAVHNEIEQPCNVSLGGVLAKHTRLERQVKEVELTVPQQAMLERAKMVLKRVGYDVTVHPILVVDSLGTNILGRAADKRIYLSRQVFDMGTKMLAGTLLEEHLHLAYMFQDETRDLQNYLINQLMTMVENHVLREPM